MRRSIRARPWGTRLLIVCHVQNDSDLKSRIHPIDIETTETFQSKECWQSSGKLEYVFTRLMLTVRAVTGLSVASDNCDDWPSDRIVFYY